jgi:hypothetical protein
MLGLVTAAGALLGAASASAAIHEQHFCWGRSVSTYPCQGYPESEVVVAHPYTVGLYVSGVQHSVCVTDWNFRNKKCTSGPNQGAYLSVKPQADQNFGFISNNSGVQGATTVYGVIYWEDPPGSGGAESSGGGATESGASGVWYLRNSNSSGIADNEFLFGGPELLPVNGDWNGDGIDTPGAYDPKTGTWYLRNSNTPGVGEVTFTFGGCCDLRPVAGDWNHDGKDTVGLYQPSSGAWYLRNSNTTGSGEISFIYGGGTSTRPIAGDWNGDGTDTIGIVDESNPGNWLWYLRNQNNAGGGEVNFNYGGGSLSEDTALVGDWNADGKDTPGIYHPSNGQWLLRNSNTAGVADMTPVYGGGSESYGIAGDWNGDGFDTIGMRR